jgi:hypothetical protein
MGIVNRNLDGQRNYSVTGELIRHYLFLPKLNDSLVMPSFPTPIGNPDTRQAGFPLKRLQE